MNISTEHGPLKVKAIYAESSFVSSCSGRVELGHVHGEQTSTPHLCFLCGYQYCSKTLMYRFVQNYIFIVDQLRGSLSCSKTL